MSSLNRVADWALALIIGFGALTAGAATQESKMFAGEKLYLPKHQSASQMFSAVLVTAKGQIIVFDGGLCEDAKHLLDILKNTIKAKQVDAWFITHGHKDHGGALDAILTAKKPERKIDIKKIYYAFPGVEWTQKNQPRGYDFQLQLQKDLAASSIEQVELKAGDSFKFDSISVTVLQTYDLNDPQTQRDLNPASTVFSVQIGKIRWLILGDIGGNACKRLLKTYGDKLRSNMVQMAHHGNGGGSEKLYLTIAPEIAIWPTPAWLWENVKPGNAKTFAGGFSSGSFTTNTTKCWLEKAGTKIHYVVLEDIVLE